MEKSKLVTDNLKNADSSITIQSSSSKYPSVRMSQKSNYVKIILSHKMSIIKFHQHQSFVLTKHPLSLKKWRIFVLYLCIHLFIFPPHFLCGISKVSLNLNKFYSLFVNFLSAHSKGLHMSFLSKNKSRINLLQRYFEEI